MPTAFVCECVCVWVCVCVWWDEHGHSAKAKLLMAISFGFLVRSPPKMKSQRRQIVKCQRKPVIYVHV